MIRLLAREELTSTEIAGKLKLSVHVVREHIRGIRQLLGVRSQLGIAVWAAEQGIR